MLLIILGTRRQRSNKTKAIKKLKKAENNHPQIRKKWRYSIKDIHLNIFKEEA